MLKNADYPLIFVDSYDNFVIVYNEEDVKSLSKPVRPATFKEVYSIAIKNETCKGCISEFEEESTVCIYCARRCDDNYHNKKEKDISDANKDYKRFFEATKLIIKKELEKRSIKEVETLVESCLSNDNIQVAMLKNDKRFQEFLKENGLFLEESK